MPGGEPGAARELSSILDPLPYHREIVDYLKTQETERGSRSPRAAAATPHHDALARPHLGG